MARASTDIHSGPLLRSILLRVPRVQLRAAEQAVIWMELATEPLLRTLSRYCLSFAVQNCRLFYSPGPVSWVVCLLQTLCSLCVETTSATTALPHRLFRLNEPYVNPAANVSRLE